AYAVTEVAHRLRRTHLVGHVVGADQDHGEVGVGGERSRDLAGEVGRLGPDPRERAQVDPAVGTGRDAAGEVGSRGLDRPVDAVTCGAGVTEEGDLDRRTWSAAAVPAGRVGWGLVAGVADRMPGQRGLG